MLSEERCAPSREMCPTPEVVSPPREVGLHHLGRRCIVERAAYVVHRGVCVNKEVAMDSLSILPA